MLRAVCRGAFSFFLVMKCFSFLGLFQTRAEMKEIYPSSLLSLFLSLSVVLEVSEGAASLAEGVEHVPYVTNVKRPVHMHVNQDVERESKRCTLEVMGQFLSGLLSTRFKHYEKCHRSMCS